MNPGKIVELGEYVEILSGYAFKSSYFNENKLGIPLIRIRDVFSNNLKTFYSGEYKKEYVVEKGDLLITMDGEFKIKKWEAELGLLNQRVCKITSSHRSLETDYLLYLLPAILKKIEDRTPYVTVKHLSVKDIKESLISLPPIETQRKIVQILKLTQDTIEKRKSQVVAINELVQSVFLDMFGNIVQDNKWTIMNFGDICETRLGKMLDKKRQDHLSQKYYLGNRHVQWGYYELDNLPQMGFSEQELEKFALKKGDLLICEGGEVGRCAIWQWDDRDIYFQKAIHRARINKNLATAEYIQYVMFFFSQNNGFKDYTTTSTIAHLTGVKLNKLPIPLPPLELQKSFGVKIKEIEKQKMLLEQSLKEMDSLYNSLLQKAFQGELI